VGDVGVVGAEVEGGAGGGGEEAVGELLDEVVVGAGGGDGGVVGAGVVFAVVGEDGPGVAAVDGGGVGCEVEIVVEAAVVVVCGAEAEDFVGAVEVEEGGVSGEGARVLGAGGAPVGQGVAVGTVPEADVGVGVGAGGKEVVVGVEAGLAGGGDEEGVAGEDLEDVVADARAGGAAFDADRVADGVVDGVAVEACARAALEEMEKRTLPADKKERVLRILSEFDATEEFPGKRDTEFAFECLRTLVGCEK
jgi:hypothetical protein